MANIKLPPNVRIKNSGYEMRCSVGYDVRGKQIRKSKVWNPPERLSEKQIEKELLRQVIAFETECRVDQITTDTVKFETLAEEWLDGTGKAILSPTTHVRYCGLRKRIYEEIGHLYIDKITVRHIQKFIDNMTFNEKNMKNGQPLSRKTTALHLGLISSVNCV
jgi:hypothetical protein